MLRHAPLPPGRCLPPSWLDDLPSLSGRWHDGVDPCRLPGGEALERCRRHWFASLGTGSPEATTTARSGADAVPRNARHRGTGPPNVPVLNRCQNLLRLGVAGRTLKRPRLFFRKNRSVSESQPARKPGHCLEPVPARAHFGKSEGGRCGCHHGYRRRPAGVDRKPGNRRNRPSRGVAGTSRRSGPRVRLVCRGKDGSASVPGTPQRKWSAKALADGVSPALSRRFAAGTARSDMRAHIRLSRHPNQRRKRIWNPCSCCRKSHSTRNTSRSRSGVRTSAGVPWRITLPRSSTRSLSQNIAA